MRNINGSSRRIAEILGVIDGIAFQSDLLSLSASVAAAGAGGDSLGFALAAVEVRSLAHRGAQAANASPLEEPEPTF
jgi:methyl-accepting chemotaxis protein